MRLEPPQLWLRDGCIDHGPCIDAMVERLCPAFWTARVVTLVDIGNPIQTAAVDREGDILDAGKFGEPVRQRFGAFLLHRRFLSGVGPLLNSLATSVRMQLAQV